MVREDGVNVYIVNLFVFSLPNGFSLDCLVMRIRCRVRFALRWVYCFVCVREKEENDKIHYFERQADYTSISEFVSRKFIVRCKRRIQQNAYLFTADRK